MIPPKVRSEAREAGFALAKRLEACASLAEVNALWAELVESRWKRTAHALAWAFDAKRRRVTA